MEFHLLKMHEIYQQSILAESHQFIKKANFKHFLMNVLKHCTHCEGVIKSEILFDSESTQDFKYSCGLKML